MKYKRFLLSSSYDDHRLKVFVENYRKIKFINEQAGGRYEVEGN